ncbi:MAG TPA: twin-arginine translocase subunit TatC [Phycisphaerales bacterium]|nr:twin-arginine translocase subunit TatC [Phycisphaerales bacterium]
MATRREHPAIMSFGDHLDELRRRLLFCILGPIPIFIVCLVYGSSLLTFLTAPLIQQLRAAGEPASLLATSPIEPFNAYLKVATIVTILVSMPWILYQLWLFISPGLHAAERRFVYFLVPLSAMLTAVAMLFLYYLVLPVSLYFLITFGSSLVSEGIHTIPAPPGITFPAAPIIDGDPDPQSIPPGGYWLNRDLNQLRFRMADGAIVGVPLIKGGAIAQQYRIGEYISLVFGLALIFALCFQVPVVLMLLSWVGILVPSDLTKFRRHILFACVVVAALFPSQDPWTLIMLSVAMYGLFELGLALMRFVPPDRVRRGLPIAERLRHWREHHQKNEPRA